VKWIYRTIMIMQITALGWTLFLLYSQLFAEKSKGKNSVNVAPTAHEALPFPTFVSWEIKITQNQEHDIKSASYLPINYVPPQKLPRSVCSPMKGVIIKELFRYISDGYHPPPPGSDERHMGVDFAFYRGQKGEEISGFEVNAILPGVAAAVIFDRPPYGNMIIIETRLEDIDSSLAEKLTITKEQSLYHLYAHLENAPAVDMGVEVYCGQFLGRVGSSGSSSNPHLHLETRYGKPGERFVSLGYDKTASPAIGITEEEKKNYFLWRTSGEFRHFDPMKILAVEIGSD